MKTHLPAGLRKALIAAMVAVSSAAYNAQSATTYIEDTTEPAIDTTVNASFDKEIVIGRNVVVTTTQGGVQTNGMTIGEYATLNSHGTISSSTYDLPPMSLPGYVRLQTGARLTVENGSLVASSGFNAADQTFVTLKNGSIEAHGITMGDDSTAVVNGHVTSSAGLTATDKDIIIGKKAEVTATEGVAGAGMLYLSNGAKLLSGGAVTAAQSVSLTGGTVEAASLTAQESISLQSSARSSITLQGALTAEEGSVVLYGLSDLHSIVKADSVTAKKGVSIDRTDLTAETLIRAGGNIRMQNATLMGNADIISTGEETTVRFVSILDSAVKGASLTAGKGDILIMTTAGVAAPCTVQLTGNLTATESNLTVMDAEVKIGGNVSTAGNMSATGGFLKVGGHIGIGGKLGSSGNTLIAAGGNITIAALADNAALTMTSAKGHVTVLTDSEATLAAADISAKGDITLGDAETGGSEKLTLTEGTTLTSTEGRIILNQNATVSNGTILAADDSIDVATGTTLTMGAESADALVGKLSGAGTINAEADALNLSDDDTAFTGTINMGGDKKLTISDKGVGADATINLAGDATALVVTGAGASLGHVRANDGTAIALSPGSAGGTATASTLTMQNGSALLIDADATSADCITVTKGVTISTPGTVHVNAREFPEDMKGDVTHTVIKLAEGAVNNGVAEDVSFNMEDGRRKLQGKNMSLVTKGDHVDLVISTNYRGTERAKPNQAAVNTTLKKLSAEADHNLGVRADTDADLAHVLDALDNTRSEGETLRVLQSLSAAGNLVVTNMMMDTTRHHLNTLRSHMGTPTCKGTEKSGNIHAAYTGGHDAIGGDEYTDDYTRTHQGALIGTDYSVSCNASVGLALGYENSTGRMDGTRADADTMFADLYTTLKTGAVTHRFSAGVALYDIETKRNVFIAAGGHSYMGSSKGSMDAISWNLGYEISRSMKPGETRTLTPFAAITLAFHQLDTLNEKGQGDASVTTNYDDPVQLDVALGVAYTQRFASFTADSSALTVSAAIHGELSKHRSTADNHFAHGPSWKTRSSERTPVYGELGASVAVPVYKTTSLIGGGTFEFSEDRVSVGGNIGVNVKF